MFEEIKSDVCRANKALVEHGLVLFTWGSVSAIDRGRDIVAIKPSGVGYSELIPEDIVVLDLDGNVLEGGNRPSSDTPTHLELYRNFSGVNAIVHTHSTYATMFAQAGKSVDCFGTTHADHFYGSVPVTRELSRQEVEVDHELNTGLKAKWKFIKRTINFTIRLKKNLNSDTH